VALSPKQIREVFLPTAMRGFDKESTETFLGHAASALEEALAERDSARQALARTEQAAEASESAISSALLIAQRAADELLDRAKGEAAARLIEAEMEAAANRTEAENQAAATLKEAENEARALREDTREQMATERASAEERLAELRLEEAALHQKLGSIRNDGRDLLELALTALDEFGALGTASGSGDGAADLLGDLRPSGSELARDGMSPAATQST
jgi:cell division septum initiation protein DivIVA